MKPVSTFRPHALLSFPFFALGLVSFLALTAWLVLQPELLFGAERGPQALTFAHVTILGWLLPFVFGAAYQLIPVIAETRLRSRGLAYTHLVLHLIAAPRLFAAILESDFASAGRWGALVAIGVVLGIANLLVTAGHRSRWSPENVGLLFALFWLLTTVGLGVALATARVTPAGDVLTIPAERVLRLHTLCGLVGFFLTTLFAVSFKLVPMFLLSPAHSRALAWWALALLHGGMLLLAPAVLFGWSPVVAVAAVAIGVSVACFLAKIASLARARLRPLDWPLRAYLTGIAMLIPVTLLAVSAALNAAGVPVPSVARPTLAVFVLGVFGVLTPAILGMAGKIVPFLAWQWRFADLLGRARVPLVSELFHPALLRAQAILLLAAIAALSAGVAWSSVEAVRLAAILLLAAGGTLAANITFLVRCIHRYSPTPLARSAPVFPVSATRVTTS